VSRVPSGPAWPGPGPARDAASTLDPCVRWTAGLALAEYPDNRAGKDNLLDAGEDQARVEHLEEIAGTETEGTDKA
jgi:hypothetical protein